MRSPYVSLLPRIIFRCFQQVLVRPVSSRLSLGRNLTRHSFCGNNDLRWLNVNAEDISFGSFVHDEESEPGE